MVASTKELSEVNKVIQKFFNMFSISEFQINIPKHQRLAFFLLHLIVSLEGGWGGVIWGLVTCSPKKN